jgi:hypothetical protein
MKHLFFTLCLLSGVIALNGCVVGGPDARRESAWIKPGFDEEMVGSELSHCSRTLTEASRNHVSDDERLHAFDMCMFNKGFRYIDSPRPMTNRGHCLSMGKNANTDNRPSCRYLRGALKVLPNNPVTPEQAAIRMVEDSPRPNGVPAFTVKCLYSLTCYNALERAEPGRVQKVIDALPDDVRTRLLNGGYWTPAAKNNRSPLFPKEK